ncbi:sensor histidine kinase [Paenibacillus lycopersici]|uniref:histidine kinase n=1 Tax=Paenibacillus lycopersici TaxID=2704462 RepID=A0A6C0G0U2_9BACL|nr:sensor histidine kinase [Paenibacillus lycopersici]QHT62487.1 sensor histidine kinase [Paenibacillus lycopersici]
MRAHSERFLPFGYKLMISYLVLVLASVITVGYFAYALALDAIRAQTETNLQGTMSQVNDNIVYKIGEVKGITDVIFRDETLQKLLRSYERGFYSYESLQNYMIPSFANAMRLSHGPAQLRIYFNNPNMFEVYGLQQFDADPLAGGIPSNRFDIQQLNRLEGEAWYQGLPWQGENTIPSSVYAGKESLWRQVDNDRRFGNMSLLRRLVDFDKLRQIGFTRTIVNLDQLLDAVNAAKFGKSSRLYVFGDNGLLLKRSGGPAMVESELEGAFGDDYLVIRQTIPETGWRLVALIPNERLELGIRKLRSMTVLVCIGSALTLLMLGWGVARYFSKRVNKIIVSLNAVRRGNFLKRIEFGSRDEFALIADAFNRMGRDVDELIREVYVTNLQKKEAELESLQAQINPHFLYNTLSSISRLAKFGEIDKLHEMVMGLSKFYRLTLNEGKNIIPVTKELEQAMTYVEIQQIKYRDRLRVYTEISPDVYGYETIKIILQPFIENILEHAMCSHSINVRLCARLEGDRLIFRIIDDGAGMTPAVAAGLFHASSEGRSGYGIYNVDERIKLQYGATYGVSIYSRPGIGTDVSIAIPAVRCD